MGSSHVARLMFAVGLAHLASCSADHGTTPRMTSTPTSLAMGHAEPSNAPAADEGELFDCDRESHRGIDRVVEVSRSASSSIIRIETNYFGGATDAVIFGMTCLGKLSEERGFPYYVILDSGPLRHGSLESPGNDWQATIGFLSTADQDLGATFPSLDAETEPRVWPATTRPVFTPALISSDAWDLFSGTHFRFLPPGEKPSDDYPPTFWAGRADEAEQRLSGASDETARLWSLGDAAKSAALAGRWDSAETWGRELLETAEPSTDVYGKAVHDGHTALGLVAMHRDELDEAQIHLLKSGMTPGSPALSSFGPSMSLARELLRAGEREVVLQYFDLCRGFWKMGDDELDQWEKVVREGGMPIFGGNLLY